MSDCGFRYRTWFYILMRYINNKFTEVGKVGQSERVSLLGIINRYPNEVLNNQKGITNFLDNRSLFSESVNGIRTNLNFLSGEEKDKGKLICHHLRDFGRG